MAIIISKNGKNAQRVEESGVADEGQLQEYIAANPDSLPLDDLKNNPPRLLVVAREFPTSSGPIDVLAVDDEGDLYIIETKLYKNPDKRLVVAQILDYGAALWKQYGDTGQFIRAIDDMLRKNTGHDLRQSAKVAFGIAEDSAANAFVDAICQNLDTGAIKFIVLMNQLHSQLRNLILFLNEKSQFDIYAVEMEFYRHEGMEIVIPKLFGADVKKDVGGGGSGGARRKWDEESFLSEAQKLPAEQFKAIETLLLESKRLTDDLSFGTGTASGSFSPKFSHASPRSFFSVYTDGRLALSFGWHSKNPTACDYLRRFEDALNNVKFCTIPKHDPYVSGKPYAEGLYVSVPAATWIPQVQQFAKIIREIFGKTTEDAATA